MDSPPRRTGHELLPESGAVRIVNRYLARERQREELRRERDTLVVAIARDIGECALAERLEVPQETVGKLLNDASTATAILDRFLHHAEIIQMTGQSYRLKDGAARRKPETR